MLSWLGCCRDIVAVGVWIFGIVGDGGIGVVGEGVESIGGVIGGI